MVPLRKSRGGQFPVLLGSPEDMDLEEVRPRPSPMGPAHSQAVMPGSPRSSEPCDTLSAAHPGHLPAAEA